MTDEAPLKTSRRAGTWLAGAAIGIAAGALALAVAELTASLGRSMRSPVLDVGDRVIDLAPSSLKELAIAVFGTNDKLALLIGIGIILTVYAAAVGVIAMRRGPVLGVLGVAAFGAAGIAAALAGGRGILAGLPSLSGAVAGGAVLSYLVSTPSEPPVGYSESRRHVLVGVGSVIALAGVLALAGRLLARRFDISSTIGSGMLPPVPRPLSPPPDTASFEVQGLSPLLTPNDDFYRIDTALSVPQISPDNYRLRVSGMVDRELNLSYSDILSRTQIESYITLTCVSNEVGGRLVGNAKWQGVRLDHLLAEAGIQDGATQIVGRSIDGYTCGFPVVAAMDGRDAMVAVGMNGEPLPAEHGFPVRLVVPGLYGYVSATKWLTEIEVTTFDAFDHYWERRGWAEQAPIKTQSRIDTPSALARLPSGVTTIAGVAWAQTRGIERVEVSVDEGPWQEAELADQINETTWRQWRLPWEVTPGRHSITCRATDSTGQTQPGQRSRPIPDGATGWHSVVVMGTET